MFGAPKQPLITSGSGGGTGITAALSTKLGLANRAGAADTSSTAAKEGTPPPPPPSAAAAQRPPLPPPPRSSSQKSLLQASSSSSPSNEPQDLSISGGGGASVDLSMPSSSKTTSFTSPKKAFMMRDAAIRESERAGEG